ncbi:unnamed protein product [Adineta ricciae]|nr:unnamed protein product [Adineta ricciae]
MPIHTFEQTKKSRVTNFLNSLGKRKISPSANKRSNTRSYFGEALSTYRSLALKQYNDIVLGHKDEDALDFWRAHQANLKVLSTMAARFLATPASSVPLESAFIIAQHHMYFANNDRDLVQRICHTPFFTKAKCVKTDEPAPEQLESKRIACQASFEHSFTEVVLGKTCEKLFLLFILFQILTYYFK